MFKKGIFTISIDIELAWAICDRPLKARDRVAILSERQVINRILGLFSRYDIPVTWAVVGHLLLEGCEQKNNIFHPEIAEPIIRRLKQDWFFQHPKDESDPLWYGRDIIEQIKNCTPKQEIASHSFSHLLYDERRIPVDAVASDIAMAKRIHKQLSLSFNVFVFPRNVVGYRNLLSPAGITVYRGKSQRWYDRLPYKLLQRFFSLMYFILAIPPHTTKAGIDEFSMVDIPDSMLLIGRNGLRALVSPSGLIKMGGSGLDRAVKRKEIFHLWFHPSNFVFRTEEQFYVLEEILKRASFLRKSGQLDILTMGEIGRQFDCKQDGPYKKTNICEEIRKKAIIQHEKTSGYFDKEYKNMAKNYFSSAFTYGRKKLQEVLDEILIKLPAGSDVLDIGCGTGEQLKMCSALGMKVTGIEPSASMRAVARKNNPEAVILDGDITNLPLKDKSFDLVMAIEVLRYLHYQDILVSYQEMLRVVKPGGKIFFTMVNRYALDGFYVYDIFKKLYLRLIYCEKAVHCEFVTPRQIRSDLEKLGVKQVEFYGRMFAPFRFVYKINPIWGIRIVRFSESFADSLSNKRYLVPFAGHLVVIAKKPIPNQR